MPRHDVMAGELAPSGRIAAGLLTALSEAGDAAGRARALRALGSQASLVHGAAGWLDVERLAAMLRAGKVEPRQARRVGQALVRPHRVGLALCYGGLATTEKAYRRVDRLLARESADCRYEAVEIGGGRGCIRFHPPQAGHAERLSEEAGRLVCAMRRGMLEAIPLLYGLVPARVDETQCAYRGAACCEFEVSWSRSPRSGLLVGAAAGVLVGAAGTAAGAGLGWPLWGLLVGAAGLVVLCAAAGRSIDLARQLEAVAGARRGHLALLDQLDSELAERMDDLAKLGVAPRPEPASPLAGREPTGLVPVQRRAPSEDGATGADGDTWVGETVDLGACLERAVERLRPEWPDAMEVSLDLESAAPPVAGEPDQLGFVIEQLLGNAAAANAEVAAEGDLAVPVLRVSLRAVDQGIEVGIEDQGEGIDPELLDKVFDPFADQGPAGRDGGLGLPVCGRIVERHGGELRVRSAGERGTRVAFVLPVAGGAG